jgi:rfaE bifunctional protein kinase chain/domain
MTAVRKRLHELVEGFAGRRVLVMGDLVADVYVQACPYKLSREAPVVIARHESERCVPGGGANVLANLAALGARPRGWGRVGEDEMGRRLVDDLDARGIDCAGLQREGETITLTRFMVGSSHTRKQQVLRLDRFQRTALDGPPDLEASVDGLVASDYGYGAVTPELCRQLAARAAAGAVVVGDSRSRLELCQGFTLVKPNHSEAEALVGHELPSAAAVADAAGPLRDRLATSALLVTLGNEGMVLAAAGSPLVLGAVGSREAVDVSGAGDTVCAIMTLGAIAGDLAAAAVLANRGAGVVVMHEGTTPLPAAALHQAIDRGGAEETEPDLQALARCWARGADRG